ncbi:hypothetical protein, partial [Pseudomonas sp. Leaf129]|uniref:hypothetical protein n=1 Tax=Pseudomonas sp. Leaf129 TaxID=1736268 RepID=UPI001F408D21
MAKSTGVARSTTGLISVLREGEPPQVTRTVSPGNMPECTTRTVALAPRVAGSSVPFAFASRTLNTGLTTGALDVMRNDI